MPIAVTDEQLQLTEAVAGFANRHAPIGDTRAAFAALADGARPGFWKALVDQGFHAVHLPESVGGQGGTLADAACVLDAAGHALLPGPLLSTIIASAIAATADDGSVRTGLLRDIAAGAAAVAVLPDVGGLSAIPAEGGWLLSGSVGPEVGLCGAERILVSARTDADAVIWVVLHRDDVGVALTAHPGTDLTRDVATMTVSHHPVRADAVVAGIDARGARCISIALTAAEAAGIARWCADNVLAHLKVREQFGRPIGAFQALQHKAARLYVDSELIAASAWDAVRAAGERGVQQRVAAGGAAVVAVAKLPDLVLDALTMFGAIGFTWEHDLHLYWRRAISLQASGGPVSEWVRELGDPDAPPREFTIELPDVDNEFRTRIREILDRAASLHNDTPGRQSPDYANLFSGPQRDALAAAGVIAPHLPTPWGLAATPVQQLIIAEEFEKRPHLVRPSLGIAEWILPTVLTFGSDQQRDRFAEPTMRGLIAWCQLFSEPGAGSDLASLNTRATRVDGGWRITGQKVWTSSAQRADWGAMLARTDPDAPKHKGIGYFLIDMSSPGVDVRPLRTATGAAHFNEVFFDDVFVPDDMLVGDPGAGWSLALATMANERAAISGYIKMDREGVLRSLAIEPGADRDGAIRALGEVRAATNAIAALSLRDTLGQLAGHSPGPATSIAKVATSLVLRRISSATIELAGRRALIGADEQPAVLQTLELPAELIGGGTIEIQLNIIATMILGLPRR